MKHWILFISVWMVTLQIGAQQYEFNDAIRLSGFGTFSLSRSDSEVPVFTYRNIDDQWCADCDSTLGLQLDWVINDQFRSSVQVVKRPQDDYSAPELEWAYLAYTQGNSTLKLGRLRIPMFLLSEYYYVSAAYPWIRPPHDIYDSFAGVTHYNGVAYEWQYWPTEQLQLKISPYIAAAEENDYQFFGKPFTLDSDGAYGLTVDLLQDDHQLHLSYLSVDSDQKQNGNTVFHYDMDMLSVGFNYLYQGYNIALETLYDSGLFADWYIGISRDMGNWLPYVQYGQLRGHANQTYLLGVRYPLTPRVVINAEWEYIRSPQIPLSGHFTQVQTAPIENDSHIFTLALSFTF
ncbi:sulfate ABC transporter permease [Vibrio gazogenes]|uniref:Sulfate ABC transporter permease n=1 Tax=Vibrio gazogenes DSM 21264 = NBRC 103151 TaxID=1123492 RepID=A0A1M4TD92_VIBGA|nr:sulfate ABC transporter permease [Vibrio gazogenes]USP16067.1 sulfate ABC transporter permease [Vibrio gazogenes]SHE42338.1 hypothetical protein SAMN02745781_00288 [Vibrio gazogenes DSM 21264] [Vibrio gazogenes DSM 21264 = NBRC 103151]SJN54265.1 hypothetical protein BQ6471_00915 [Vibrio gazogenes]